MENFSETKTIIGNAKNIYLIPSDEPEAAASALALFYTLKELGKNVNFMAEHFPDTLKFLTPSLDFISYPKNFIISIPKRVAEVSQIYYEKSDNDLKIHLTLDKGQIKKDDIAFYVSEARPDLIVTVGVKDYTKELTEKLNSFGFLLDSPILNIDSEAVDIKDEHKNKKFGKINIVESKSLPETVLELARAINPNQISKPLATCLLAGIVIYTKNFKTNVTAQIFEASAELMKQGAELKEITHNILAINL